MNERAQWAVRVAQRQDLEKAMFFLRAMVVGCPSGSIIDFDRMAAAVEEAYRWLGTVHGGAEPLRSTTTMKSESDRFEGATHVLYQRSHGLERA